MGRFLRYLLLLLLIALAIAAAYIAIADIPPPTRELVHEVPHDLLFKSP